MSRALTAFHTTPRFERDLRKLPPDVREDAFRAIEALKQDPVPQRYRMHALHGHQPKIFKIDVRPDRSWQISFNICGTTVHLRRVCTHAEIDRIP